MEKLRVLVADGSEFRRIAYKRILETQDHFEVVGLAADGEDAVRKAEELRADVTVIDIRLPKINGIQAAALIASRRPATGIVVVAQYNDTEYVLELLKDRAQGKAYLLQTSVDDVAELIRAVGSVAAGLTVLDAAIVERLTESSPTTSGSPLSQLTITERQAVLLLAEGYTNAEIALALAVGEQVAEQYVNAVYEKLDLLQWPSYQRQGQAVLSLVSWSRFVAAG